MTSEELATVLEPLLAALQDQAPVTVDDLNLALEPVIEVVNYQSGVIMALILGLGLVVGILLIRLLFDWFK